jgi:type II secretory ATPase GspE/PulE/Tfp pilus assembly ATPase PilB-like protein
MMPLEAMPPAAFSFLAAFWSLLAVAWAAAFVWIDRSVGRSYGRIRLWKYLLAAIGGLLFLGTVQWGAGVGFPAACLLAASLAAYVLARHTRSEAFERIVPVGSIRRIAKAIGADSLLDAFSGVAARLVPAVPRGSAPVFLKKDGSVYGDADRDASKAVKVAQRIFAEAIQRGATDVHLEPKADRDVQVRYRIDGMMQAQEPLPTDVGRAVISTFKVVADMDIAERRRPQDGGFAVLCAGRTFDVRVNSGPTGFGEKIALRLLDPGGGILRDGLGGLGMRDSLLKTLRSIIHRSHGMLIVCGPTGSGKTTSVYGALSEIDALSRNIVTIEDPIEYRLDDISQTAVNTAADLTFANILRAVLRQDPDVILVGEIRDKETAEIAMQSALTGHFVFTTLHANDAPTTVTRLLDIGIDATLLQSAVTAVLAQRLVRVLCPRCKRQYKPTQDELVRNQIPVEKVGVLYEPQGCESCGQTGYSGRTGVYELMVIDSAIRELLVGRPSLERIRAACQRNRMRTLRRAAVIKAVEGVTSLAEVDRVVPDDGSREVDER